MLEHRSAGLAKQVVRVEVVRDFQLAQWGVRNRGADLPRAETTTTNSDNKVSNEQKLLLRVTDLTSGLRDKLTEEITLAINKHDRCSLMEVKAKYKQHYSSGYRDTLVRIL